MSYLGYWNALATIEGFKGNTGVASVTPDKFVQFRSATSPLIQSPPVSQYPPVPGPGGQYRDVFDGFTFQQAAGAVVPGDVIRILQTVPQPLLLRGNKYGIDGANMTSMGHEDNPIQVYTVPEAWIDPGDISNGVPALDINNTEHVHPIGVQVRNSQFGIRFMNVDGTSNAKPNRTAFCKLENLGHAAMAHQGWYRLITASNGTPPNGIGNELGYSKYHLVEYNMVNDPGRLATQFGECFYAGKGAGPTGYNGWYGYCDEITYRGNEANGFTADGFDIKPGCRRIRILHNLVASGAAHFGAPLSILYVANTIDVKPAWMDTVDPEVYIEQNRIFDLNLSLIQGSTAPWMMYGGQSGIRAANNLFWAWPQGSSPFNAAIRLRMEQQLAAAYGTFPTWYVHNTFWGRGVENAGWGTVAGGGVTAFVLGAWYNQRNNIYATGTSGGEHAADSADFEADVPAVGTLDDAAWSTFGFGSAFDLKDASDLVGDGTAFDASQLWLPNEDISQRTLAHTGANPGAFQPY